MPRPTAPSTRPSLRSGWPVRTSASSGASARCPRGFGGLAPLILRYQRELFVVGAELATNPDAWDRLEDGKTRVSRGDGRARRARPHRARGEHRDAAGVRRPRRDPDERSAGARADDPPAGRAPRRGPPAGRKHSGSAPRPIPEPPRRPRLGLGARRRTCRIASSDAGPTAGCRTSKGESNVTFQGNQGGAASASQPTGRFARTRSRPRPARRSRAPSSPRPSSGCSPG